MKASFLTKFSLLLLLLATGLSAYGRESPQSYSGKILIQPLNEKASLLSFVCGETPIKRCPSREIASWGKIPFDVTESIALFVAPTSLSLYDQALDLSKNFFKLTVLSSKHHPPTSV